MLLIDAPVLSGFAASIFEAAGVDADEALIVSEALVGANLAGHDSHGVMRIPSYLDWMERGDVAPGAEFEIVSEAPAFAVVDGHWGFGQVQGRRATELAIRKAREAGVATVSGRRCAHLGRLGDYPRMAAQQGMAAVVYINTHGAGLLTAPFGGIDKRLAANPIAMAFPRPAAEPIVIDVSTCVIAEGKVRNFRTAGQPVPEGCLLDSQGRPTTDPNDLYNGGALLPVGGHKGYALGVAADILAGAISGAGCSGGVEKRIANSFLMQLIDIERVRGMSGYEQDVGAFVEWIKSSRLAPGFDEILMPGDPELRTEQKRRREGIPIHEATWTELRERATKLGVRELPDAATS